MSDCHDEPECSQQFDASEAAELADDVSANLAEFVAAPPAALLRIVLVDSLSPGNVVEMRVEGGTALTGINGRGKTSNLQLVPLFWGETGNRIVKPGKDSFLDYYLKRTTSYLVFEYRNHAGDARSVAIHADRHGKKTLYRFIRAGFSPAHYIDGKAFVESQNLLRHLKLQGVACSNEVIENNTEFRAILQATPALAGTGDRDRKAFIRAMIADYAMSQRPIPQLEKLVAGMFHRSTNFEHLQAMVVNCVDERMKEAAVEVDHSDLEQWPESYLAYTKAFERQPDMVRAVHCDSEIRAIDKSLAQYRQKLLSLTTHLQTRRDDLFNDRQRLSGELDALSMAHTKAIEDLKGARAEAEGKRRDAHNRITQLETRKAEFEAQGIEALARKVDQIDTLRFEIEGLEARINALVGEQSALSERYEKLKRDAQSQFDVADSALRDERERLRQDLSGAMQMIEDEMNTARDGLETRFEQARTPLQDAHNQAMVAEGQAAQAKDAPNVDPAIVALYEQKRESMDQAREAKDVAEKAALRLYMDKKDRQNDLFSAKDKLSDAGKKVIALNAQLERTIRQATPERGSLLHFLREQVPDWGSDIARVIREDLLERKDLSPDVSLGESALYGLVLDLSKLDALPAADPTGDQQLIEQARAALDAGTQVKGLAQQAVDAADKAFKRANEAVITQQSTLLLAQQAHKTAESECQAAKHQLELARKNRIAEAKAAYDAARTATQAAMHALTQHDLTLKREKAQIELLRREKKDAIKSAHDSKIAQIESARTMRLNAHRAQLAEIDQDCLAVLKSKGVDTERVGALQKTLAAQKEALAEAQAAVAPVTAWRLWKTHEYARLCEYQEALKQNETAILGFDERIDAAQAAHKAQVEQIDIRIKACHREETEIEKTRADAALQDELLGAFEIDRERVLDYDPSWTLPEIAQRVGELRNGRKAHAEVLKKTIGTLYNAFSAHPGSMQAQYLEMHREAVGLNERNWIAPLKAWFDEHHEKDRGMILAVAKNLGAEIHAFQRNLSAFDQRVKRFNRELQDNLDQSAVFESISKIILDVSSGVDSLPYWSSLKALVDEDNMDWLQSMNDLPPKAFVDRLRDLLGHWEVKSGLRADYRNLVRISGSVVENGNLRVFKTAAELDNVSSNGLSYLVLITLFVGFVNLIRGKSNLNVAWALDEFKDISLGNVHKLMEMLKRNNITLVTAYPDPDPDSLPLFENWYSLRSDRRLSTPSVAERNRLPANVSAA